MPIRKIGPIARYCLAEEHGDIIKQFVIDCIGINCIETAQAMLCALGERYGEINDIHSIDTQSDNFIELLKLAKKLASCFSGSRAKNRDAVMYIHESGIQFARDTMDSDHCALPFFGLLEVFSSKLTSKDKGMM